MSNFVPSRFWKTMPRPSGDQRGRRWWRESVPSVVTCSALRPRASATQIRVGPLQRASNAMRVPDGDHDGFAASLTTSVALRVARSSSQTSPPT